MQPRVFKLHSEWPPLGPNMCALARDRCPLHHAYEEAMSRSAPLPSSPGVPVAERCLAWCSYRQSYAAAGRVPRWSELIEQDIKPVGIVARRASHPRLDSEASLHTAVPVGKLLHDLPRILFVCPDACELCLAHHSIVDGSSTRPGRGIRHQPFFSASQASGCPRGATRAPS